MNIQEAIKEVEIARDIFIDERCVSDREDEEVRKEFEIVISAAKKQIPKKIKNRSVFKTFPMSVHGDCPACGSKNLSSADMDYCNACGQKLDWSDEN